MLKKIDDYFGITRLGSTFRIEIFAGLSTFLALSYIFVVNPAILSAMGLNKSAIFFATIVGSVVATLAMGLWAKKPFAVAPGLEMDAYVAYVVVGVLGFTWQGALGAVFWSGVLCCVLNYTRIRVKIMNAIPDKLKSGLACAVGVFLLLIALKVSGMLAYDGIQVKGLGMLTSPEAIVFYAGLAMVVLFKYLKLRGAVLFSIIGASIVAHMLGVGQVLEPIAFSKDMFKGVLQLDIGIITNPKIWSVIIILFILDFYGSIAKFIGLTRNTSIVDKDGNMPNVQEALTVDGAGSVLGSTLGTSNLITFVESAVGIGEGGRTGLVAVVISILMALFLVITPLLNLVPVIATTGALFFVGLTLFPTKKELKTYTVADIVSVLAMVVVTVWTFGLDKAMFAGFLAFLVFFIVKRQWNNINMYLVGSTLILFVSILLSSMN